MSSFVYMTRQAHFIFTSSSGLVESVSSLELYLLFVSVSVLMCRNWIHCAEQEWCERFSVWDEMDCAEHVH